MIHKLITTLRNHLSTNEWLFLLTAYELGKGGWVSRIAVIEAAELPQHGSNVSSLCGGLNKLGLIGMKIVPNARNQGSYEVKLTPEGKALIRKAFESAQNLAPSQPVTTAAA
jgi:Mn-dependent DtxR family transcriptional regulator